MENPPVKPKKTPDQIATAKRDNIFNLATGLMPQCLAVLANISAGDIRSTSDPEAQRILRRRISGSAARLSFIAAQEFMSEWDKSKGDIFNTFLEEIKNR